MAEKENDKRKLRAELDKVRKQRDILEQKVPTLDGNINDLQVIVDKLSKDVEKEGKRREVASKDKDQALEKLRTYQEVYEALNIQEPGQFLQNYENLKAELVNLSSKMAEKQK